jgi:hypothetical protein
MNPQMLSHVTSTAAQHSMQTQHMQVSMLPCGYQSRTAPLHSLQNNNGLVSCLVSPASPDAEKMLCNRNGRRNSYKRSAAISSHLLAHALMRWCAIAKGGGMKNPRLLQERFWISGSGPGRL